MNFQPRTVDGIDRIGVRQWEELDSADNPFLNWHFLHALEASGSVSTETGWQPNHICLFEGQRLVAAAPSYIKTDSRGEFVFDWAWADGYHRAGLPYYPKLLTAVPWTPVSGPRLLVARDHPDPQGLRNALIETALAQCNETGMSSWHCNFVTEPDIEALSRDDLLLRKDYQFHWRNHDFRNFNEFLSTLKSKKRKNIRQERQQVEATGIRFEERKGNELDDDDIRFIHQCYRRTHHAHGNHPALTPDCFARFIKSMPDNILVIIASDGVGVASESHENHDRLAMSLFLKGGDTLYGRYWGTLREVPGLHFEAAYYRGIEHCIRHGLKRFESGAQGEHKIARGFTPVRTCSAHFIRHDGFRSAIRDYLDHEADWLDGYRGEIGKHEPFRRITGN